MADMEKILLKAGTKWPNLGNLDCSEMTRATHCLIEELTLRSEREKSQPALRYDFT